MIVAERTELTFTGVGGKEISRLDWELVQLARKTENKMPKDVSQIKVLGRRHLKFKFWGCILANRKSALGCFIFQLNSYGDLPILMTGLDPRLS